MDYLRKLCFCLFLVFLGLLGYSQNAVYPVRHNGLWGYVNTQGVLVIPATYDRAYPFQSGVAKVERNGKNMLINSQGEALTPHGINDFTHLKNRLIFSKDQLYGMADVGGKIIRKAQFSSIVGTPVSGIFKISRKNKTGLMDSSGRIVVPCHYVTIELYEGNFWLLSEVDENRYSYYIPKHKLHVKETYLDIRLMANKVFLKSNKKHWDVLTDSNENFGGFKWTSLLHINQQYFMGVHKKDSTLFQSNPLKSICSNKGFVESSDSHRLVLNQHSNRFIVLNTTVVPDTFDMVNLQPDNSYLVYKNGFANLLDSSLNPLLEWKYTTINVVTADLIRITTPGGIGLYSRDQGKEILSCRFTSLFLYDTRIKTFTQEKSLMLFEHNNGVIGDSMEFLNHRTAVAREGYMNRGSSNIVATDTGIVRAGRWFTANQLWGYQSTDGRVLIPPRFSSYTMLNGSRYTLVKKDIYSKRTGRLLVSYQGLVDEELGFLILKPRYSFIDTKNLGSDDIRVIRARRSNGKFELVRKGTGRLYNYNSPFIDEFVNGRARIYLNGHLSYVEKPSNQNLGEANAFCAMYRYSLGTSYTRFLSQIIRRYRAKQVRVYAVGGQWSYIDENGRLLFDNRYSSAKIIRFAQQFDPVNAVVFQADSCALIDRSGQHISRFEYANIEKLGQGDSAFYRVTKESSSYNYYSSDGQKIGNVFTYGSDLNDGAAWVKHKNQFAILRADGSLIELKKKVIPYRHTFHNGYSAVHVDNKWAIIDTTGRFKTKPSRGRIKWCSEGYYAQRVSIQGNNGRKTRGYQIFNINGTPISPTVYARTHPFKNGFAPVRIGSKRLGFVDTLGNLIANNKFDKIIGFQTNGLSIVRKGSGLGVVNTEGNTIVKTKYADILFSDSTILCYRSHSVWLYDIEGRQLKKYTKVSKYSGFEDGLALIKADKKAGYIDQQGNWKIKPTYRYATKFGNGAALVFSKTGYRVINTFGSEITTLSLSSRPMYSEGLILNNTSLGFSFYNTHGKLISKDYYQRATPFKNGYAKVKKNGRWGVIDVQGNYILPMEYAHIRINDQGEISAQKSLSYGLLDQKGVVVVEPTFDQIEYRPQENIYKLMYGFLPSYLDEKGIWIWKQKQLAGL